jgi:hypothetical protein
MSASKTTKAAAKATPVSAYADNPPPKAQRVEIGELEARYDQKDTGEPDPRDVELADLRQRLDTQEAAIGRLQDLIANAVMWADCQCGQDDRSVWNTGNAIILNGRLYHDKDHRSFYGSQVEQ